MDQQVRVAAFTQFADVALNSITILTNLFGNKAGQKITMDAKELSDSFKLQFSGQVFCVNQILAMDFNGTKLDLAIEGFAHADLSALGGKAAPAGGHSNRGQILPETSIVWKKNPASTSTILFTGE